MFPDFFIAGAAIGMCQLKLTAALRGEQVGIKLHPLDYTRARKGNSRYAARIRRGEYEKKIPPTRLSSQCLKNTSNQLILMLCSPAYIVNRGFDAINETGQMKQKEAKRSRTTDKNNKTT